MKIYVLKKYLLNPYLLILHSKGKLLASDYHNICTINNTNNSYDDYEFKINNLLKPFMNLAN